MYTDFYGLKEKPFNLTPSPRFLYLGENHREALALLTYGVKERMGFILLTGEVGTGKTTMVRALLNGLDQGVHCAYLSNPALSRKDFFNYLAFSAFGKKVNFRSKTEFLLEFESFLRKCLQHHKIFILIIDEAQKLSLELLEEIRLLSNMESAEDKLVNIFLVGQPELNQTLSRPECRPLLQRISIRYHIPPLDHQGTAEYLAARLKTAGAGKVDSIFSRGAVKAIHEYSRGYPRMINVLADNALLMGYSRDKKPVGSVLVEECFRDLALDNASRDKEKQPFGPVKPAEARWEGLRKTWKWAALVLIVLALLALLLVQNRKAIYANLNIFAPMEHRNASMDRPRQQQPLTVKRPIQEPAPQEPGNPEPPLPVPEKGMEQGQAEPPEKPVLEKISGLLPEEEAAPLMTVVVKEGDTFAELVKKSVRPF